MLRELTARLVGQGLVDSRLIFVVGDSTGGAMAIRAVCSGLGQSIAGLATIDATMPADLTATCGMAKPVAYIAVDGESRSQNPSGGGEVAVNDARIAVAALPTAVALFGKSAGCMVEPSPAPFVVVDQRTGDVASIERFSGCKAPVEQVRIISDGKAASVKIGASNDRASRRSEKIKVDAANLVWAFLKNLGA
jgi:polyhydroxybutyrate depolymerase